MNFRQRQLEFRGMSGTAPQSLAQTYGLRSGRVLPQHSHSESHWALVSDSRCESEAAIAIPQLIINQQPETDDDSELPQSARSGLSWICSLGHRMSGSPSSLAASAKVRRQRRFNALQGGDWQRNPAVWKHDRPSHLASYGQISDSHEARSKIPAGAREIARSVAISRPCQHAFATHEADVLVHVRQLVLRLLSY